MAATKLKTALYNKATVNYDSLSSENQTKLMRCITDAEKIYDTDHITVDNDYNNYIMTQNNNTFIIITGSLTGLLAGVLSVCTNALAYVSIPLAAISSIVVAITANNKMFTNFDKNEYYDKIDHQYKQNICDCLGEDSKIITSDFCEN